MSAGPHGDRPGYHPVLWGTLGALTGGALGFVLAGVTVPLLDPLLPNEDGLEDIALELLVISAFLMVSLVSGAIAGAKLLLRWHRGRA